MGEFGKLLVVFGAIVIIIGLSLQFLDKIPFLGKLPGDILIQKNGFTFYFPLTTSIVISVLLSILFTIFK